MKNLSNERRIMLAATAVAILMVAGLVVFRMFNTRQAPLTVAEFEDRPEVASLLDGLPQRGAVLGADNAPVTIVEYIDYKCVHCAEAARDIVPELVTRYVRPGKASIRLAPLAFLARDSTTGALAGLAAARQDKMWQFTELVLRNQGDESTQWLTSDYVQKAATAAGLDPVRLADDMKRPAVREQMVTVQRQAEVDEARRTPFWVVTGPSGVRTVTGAAGDEVYAAVEAVSPR